MSNLFENGGMIGSTLNFITTEKYVVSSSPVTPTYVGGVTDTFTGSATGGNIVDISSITDLTAGDIIIVVYCVGSASNRAPSLFAVEFTEITSLYANGTQNETTLYVGYRISDGTEDSISLSPTGNTYDAGSAVVKIWRGIDNTNPIDVTVTTSVNSSNQNPDPPAITPVSENALIIVAGGSAHDLGSSVSYTASGLSDFSSISGNDIRDSTAGLGAYYDWTSGSYDPSSWSLTTDSGSSSVAATIALRPSMSVVYGNFKNSGVWDLESSYSALLSEYKKPLTAQFNGYITSSASINDYIDMGTPEEGDIQIFAVVGQTVGVPTNPTGITEVLDTGIFNSYDEIQFYKIDTNRSGLTQFVVSATYRVSVFAWTIKADGRTVTLTDTGYNNEGTTIDTLNVSERGCVLAVHTSYGSGIDVTSDLVETSDVASTVVESSFEVSAGHSIIEADTTLSMRLVNDTTVSRTLVAAVSYSIL
jgi:hypothetical protein